MLVPSPILPDLSGFLDEEKIPPGKLYRSIERYTELLSHTIAENYDQFERPIEWLDIKEQERKILEFLELLPKILDDAEDAIFEDVDDEDDD